MTKADYKKLLIYLKDLPPSKERDLFIKKLEKDTIKIKPRSAKNKGRGFQQWIAKQIAEYTGLDYGSEDDSSIASRPMSQNGVDIILRGEAKEKFPWAVEAKNTEALSLYPTIEQAKNNIGNFKYWLIVHKKNNSDPIAILDFRDFMDIYFRKDG
jgi:hypothetical protein